MRDFYFVSILLERQLTFFAKRLYTYTICTVCVCSQLLNDFFKSAATALSARGEIHVALCDGQGG